MCLIPEKEEPCIYRPFDFGSMNPTKSVCGLILLN